MAAKKLLLTKPNTAMASRKPVLVREVWEDNLAKEFALIESILDCYPYVAMDTEFPGVVFPLNVRLCDLTPADSYLSMKKNVDALKLIQFGLTMSDVDGNLPDFGTSCCFVWQFNFRDFDVDQDLHNPGSIALLKQQGIDFVKNKQRGVDSEHFAMLLLKSRLVCVPWLLAPEHIPKTSMLITWVTFHSIYDFGYLIKVVTQSELPGNLETFMMFVRIYFGMTIYDMKHIMDCLPKKNRLHGGLEMVAKTLEIDRVAGKSHQAGSDSLLTMQTFIKLQDKYFHGDERDKLNAFSCKLYGLVQVM